MDVIVKRLGRKGWDESHQLCLDAVIYLFQHDTTTTAFNSLHLVRLISRLVRARGFAVRPEVISALLNLRLKEELGGGRIRASASAKGNTVPCGGTRRRTTRVGKEGRRRRR